MGDYKHTMLYFLKMCFFVMLGIQTQFFVLTQQAFPRVSHLSSPTTHILFISLFLQQAGQGRIGKLFSA